MLYISRFAGRYCYGVVDTDDGTEEVVAGYDITNAVSNLGLSILGVDIDPQSTLKPTVDSILPYHDVTRMTPLQVKTNLLQHVEVFVFGDIIANVRFRADEITVPSIIRLSDFGKVCGDRMLYGNRPSGAHKITLILDDKLSFSKHTFLKPTGSLGKSGLGVVLDMREMHDDGEAKAVYKSIMSGPGTLEMMDSIIDDRGRKEWFIREVLTSEV